MVSWKYVYKTDTQLLRNMRVNENCLEVTFELKQETLSINQSGKELVGRLIDRWNFMNITKDYELFGGNAS